MGADAQATLLSQVRQAASDGGLDAIGVTGVAPLTEALAAIVERKAAGLHAGMWFTYGRPERSTTPAAILPGARSVVVCARRYRPPSEPEVSDGAPANRGHAAVAAYAATDAYGALRDGLTEVSNVLRRHGFSTAVVYDDNRLVDRAAAARAGLGWLGRNTMLLSRELGSWTVLGSVVTTAALPIDGDMQSDGCGTCRRCQTACPTGALEVAGVLDANLCLAWLVQAPGIFPPEFRAELGDRLYGCDDCQTVCPFNDPVAPPPTPHRQTVTLAASHPERASVDIVETLNMTDDDLIDTFGHWYIPRRRPEFLRRNALVVLGNIGDPDSEGVVQALRRSLSSSDAVVAGHAVWAARRLGRDDLISAAEATGLGAHDPDGLVAAELARDVRPRQNIA